MENRAAFDELAEAWYRKHHWSRFRADLEGMAGRWGGGRLLNVGCGHGADFLPFKDRFELHGIDFSTGMFRVARRYAAKFHFEAHLAAADARCLPYAEASFDAAIAVAVYHHIRGIEDRRQALIELKRVLRPGGEAFITVWNRLQPHFWFKGRDVLVPWHLKEKTVQRYYHLYTYREFCRALEGAGFTVLSIVPEKSYHGPFNLLSRNICALVRKG